MGGSVHIDSAAGHGTAAISKAMHLSASTAKTHVAHLYDKLEVSDRAVALAWETARVDRMNGGLPRESRANVARGLLGRPTTGRGRGRDRLARPIRVIVEDRDAVGSDGPRLREAQPLAACNSPSSSLLWPRNTG